MRRAPAVFLNLILPPLGFIVLGNRNRFFVFACISIAVSLLSPFVLFLASYAPAIHLAWVILVTIGLRVIVLIQTFLTLPGDAHPLLARTFGWLLVSAFVFLDVAACSFQRYTSPGLFLNGVGAEASLSRGDFVYLLRNLDAHILRRGDIIAYEDHETRQISRVIGLPGETIRIEQSLLNENGRSYWISDIRINGVLLPLKTSNKDLNALNLDLPSGDYLLMEQSVDNRTFPVIETSEAMRVDIPEIHLQPDQYFLMGDNRDNSRDSREFGYIHRSRILFRYIYTAASFNFKRGPCEDRTESKTMQPTPAECLDVDRSFDRGVFANWTLEWKRAVFRPDRIIKIAP